MHRKKISIIGYGAFGQLWAQILSPYHEVVVYGGRDYLTRAHEQGVTPVTREQALLESEVIFYAVPMSAFASVYRADIELIESRRVMPLVADLLSVKVHPKEVFESCALPGLETLLLHPMFGPMSYTTNGGVAGLRIVVDASLASRGAGDEWIGFFRSIGALVIEMSAGEHDRLSARTQAITHLFAKMGNTLGLEHTIIDTTSASDMIRVIHSLRADGGQLFEDLFTLNPYAQEMLAEVQDIVQNISNQTP